MFDIEVIEVDEEEFLALEACIGAAERLAANSSGQQAQRTALYKANDSAFCVNAVCENCHQKNPHNTQQNCLQGVKRAHESAASEQETAAQQSSKAACVANQQQQQQQQPSNTVLPLHHSNIQQQTRQPQQQQERPQVLHKTVLQQTCGHQQRVKQQRQEQQQQQPDALWNTALQQQSGHQRSVVPQYHEQEQQRPTALQDAAPVNAQQHLQHSHAQSYAEHAGQPQQHRNQQQFAGQHLQPQQTPQSQDCALQQFHPQQKCSTSLQSSNNTPLMQHAPSMQQQVRPLHCQGQQLGQYQQQQQRPATEQRACLQQQNLQPADQQHRQKHQPTQVAGQGASLGNCTHQPYQQQQQQPSTAAEPFSAQRPGSNIHSSRSASRCVAGSTHFSKNNTRGTSSGYPVEIRSRGSSSGQQWCKDLQGSGGQAVAQHRNFQDTCHGIQHTPAATEGLGCVAGVVKPLADAAPSQWQQHLQQAVGAALSGGKSAVAGNISGASRERHGVVEGSGEAAAAVQPWRTAAVSGSQHNTGWARAAATASAACSSGRGRDVSTATAAAAIAPMSSGQPVTPHASNVVQLPMQRNSSSSGPLQPTPAVAAIASGGRPAAHCSSGWGAPTAVAAAGSGAGCCRAAAACSQFGGGASVCDDASANSAAAAAAAAACSGRAPSQPGSGTMLQASGSGGSSSGKSRRLPASFKHSNSGSGSDDSSRAAAVAAPRSQAHSQQQGLQVPLQLAYHGVTRYTFNPHEVDWLCQQLLDAGPPSVVGFDLEWRPHFKRGCAPNKAALLQLAYAVDKQGTDWRPKADGKGVVVLLLHIFYSGITPKLQEILVRDDIVKVGVNIGGDVSKLMSDFNVEVGNTNDLSDMANSRQLRCVEGITANIENKRWSLAGLVDEVLCVELPKPQHIRMGNWEKVPLNDEQQCYAAMDAYACLLLHWEMQELPERLTLSQQMRQAMKERAAAAAEEHDE